MRKINKGCLYLVLSEEYGNGRPAIDIAAQAIQGGIDILQMREKHKSHEELVRLGIELSMLCHERDVTFIVNDDPYLAVMCNADGVHMGQEDILQLPIEAVRRIIGKEKIIGLSTHSVEQFRKAECMDIDYIAFGPIFPTRTKDYNIGIEGIKEVVKITSKSIIFIGGINTENLDTILAEGASNIALIRDIMQAEDIISRTRWYKNKLMGHKDKEK